MIAFPTADEGRRQVGGFSSAAPTRGPSEPAAPAAVAELANDDVSALFQAVVEATEEAIYNSLFMATPVTSRGGTVEPIPLDRVREVLRKYRVGAR